MKSLKIALHWQIIFAIILASAFGVLFPTKYKITFDSYEKFIKEAPQHGISDLTIAKIQIFRDKEPFSQSRFLSEIQKTSPELNEYGKKEFLLNSARFNPNLSYISWLGELFLRLLKMIIIPLILTSIISGTAAIGSGRNLGRISLKTLIYYLLTSGLAIAVGLFFVNLIKPGIGVDIGLNETIENSDLIDKSVIDSLMQIVPENIFKSLVNQEMLSIIGFSMLFGYFIIKAGKKSKNILTDFFNASFDVMLKITTFIIKFAPLGIFAIIAKTVADQAGDPEKLMLLARGLGKFAGVVLAGFAIHTLITLPFILKFISKVRPFKHFRAVESALLTAFSTRSSAAALSLTMESVENKSGVSNKISGFILPLGATVNMNGTVLYECVAAIFIAQAYGIDLTISEQLIIFLSAILVSIGSAGIPMASLLMISIVLSTVNLPLEGIGLILAIDPILDMFRTSVNVWSDACCAVFVAKSEGETLKIQ
jgi:Na+/H+-dicarboxylate symporter